MNVTTTSRRSTNSPQEAADRRSSGLPLATDLAFEDAHLADADALTEAIDTLLARKPHLTSRRVVGDVGHGASGGGRTDDLASIDRATAS